LRKLHDHAEKEKYQWLLKIVLFNLSLAQCAVVVKMIRRSKNAEII
jgi:hypothetical protein